MHGILSYANMGVKKFDTASDENKLKYFNNIKISAERLMTLLNDLLDFSKLESGKMEFNFNHNNLKEVTEKCIGELQSRLDDRSISIDFTLTTNNTSACFDHLKIHQVIINLLSNAINFSPNDNKIEILISRSSDTSHNTETTLKFSIRDHGQGINDSELQIIFNKFEQGSQLDFGTTHGTGLGLAICHEIIELHHGKIWAENHPDGGAVFSFLLPVDNASDKE